ncbi:50S ribosomal protein L34e [Candidatus Bathyarchaeota archaeon]|nr:50S ribosomal protein L34e [Candidatus Bathyarchaeota archaeon]
MPQPHLRTRSKKRLKTPLPGGKKQVHYKKEKTSASTCAMCGQLLSGISRLTPSKVRKLNRTKRKIWRLHGGNLCHNCLKNALKQAARTL